MGAWGSGPFDNDDAMDWVWELEGATGDARLVAAFEAVVEAGVGESFDVTEGATAIAAASVLAGALDGTTDGLPEEAVAYLERWVADPEPELISLAIAAVDRTSGAGSEVADLWDESEDATTWRGSIAQLRGRLQRFA